VASRTLGLRVREKGGGPVWSNASYGACVRKHLWYDFINQIAFINLIRVLAKLVRLLVKISPEVPILHMSFRNVLSASAVEVLARVGVYIFDAAGK